MMWFHASRYPSKSLSGRMGVGASCLSYGQQWLCISLKLCGLLEMVLCKARILFCNRVGFIPNLDQFSRRNDSPHPTCLVCPGISGGSSHPLSLLLLACCLPVGEFQESPGDDGA